MKPASVSKMAKYLLLVMAALVMTLGVMSCRNDEPAVPPLTGPSGHRLFLTMEATPDHLLIVQNCNNRQVSHITAQLKNQLGQGVPGEHIRLRILNTAGFEVAIGRLENSELTTDGAGFVRTDYIAPCTQEHPAGVRIKILAFMTNPDFVNEVNDTHILELDKAGDPGPGGACGPTALNPAFTFTPAAPAIGDEVCFDGSTTTSTDAILSLRWSFGDGGTASGITACHTFNSAGSFFVTLTATDAGDNVCTATQSVGVTGGIAPSCNITASPSPVAPNQDVNLTATVTDADSTHFHFNWNFGDGSSSSTTRNTVTHRYKTTGTFTVNLTVTDDQGNIGTCSLSITVADVVGVAPTCAFTTSPAAPAPGDAVQFNASTSTDADGAITTYRWDFGDGTEPVTEHDPLTSHSYALAGTYTVTLTVTDNDGNSTSCTSSVTITGGPPPPPNVPPTCSFTHSPVGGTTATSFNFNASASADIDGSIVSYDWDYGDGATFFGDTDPFPPPHTYGLPGTYTVTLVVTDDDGASTVCINLIIVT